MESIYKYLFFITLFVVLFSNCKKETTKNIPENLTEQWKTLDENTIYISNRNILSSSTSYNKLYFQTPYVFYEIDSNFNRINAWGDGPNFDNGFMKPFVGKNFMLYFDNPRPQYLNIIDKNSFDVFGSYYIRLNDTTYNDYFTSNAFSNVDENDNFCHSFLSGVENRDTCLFFIKKYHVSRGPQGSHIKCDLLFSRNFGKNQSFYPTDQIHLINDVVYFSIHNLGFRYDPNGKLDTIDFNLRRMIKIDSVIYATSGFNFYKNILNNSGLYRSFDNGNTWQRVGNGDSFSQATGLVNVNGKLLMYSQFWVASLDFSNNTVKKINTTDIKAQIKTITEFKDHVFIGTDAGVYYKSTKGFFND